MTGLSARACDCHTHVIGDSAAYPMVGERQYTPGPASVADLKEHMRHLGLQRVVIVQPSVYGTDNRCLLDSLAAFEGQARGIAVVAEDMGSEGLAALHAAGVRGLRINLESSAERNPDALVEALRGTAARVACLPWHLQVYADLETIAEAAPQLADLGVPLVLDHFAMTPAATPEGDPRLQRLACLLRSGAVYIKLSGAYRIGGNQADALRLARLFIDANPDRVLWASDWPHTNREAGKGPLEVSAYRNVELSDLASQIASWPSTSGHATDLLVDNPARLYGF